MDAIIEAIEDLMKTCREERRQPTYSDLLKLLKVAQTQAPRTTGDDR